MGPEVAWYIATIIISVALSVAMAPKPTQPEAATLGDFDIPQVDEGTPQAVWFGDCWTGDWQVLAYGNLRTSKVTAKQAKK